MRHIDLKDAARDLVSLVDAAERGEEIIIHRDGKPAARLISAGVVARDDPPSAEVVAQRRKALTELREMASQRGLRISHEEIKAWIRDPGP
jgi:prevent-host-death family protein